MDLHIHSNLSADGIYSVEEILTFAEKAGVDGISITDHNSALSHQIIANINKEKYYNGTVISGMEIDTVHNGVTFEILGYNFNVDKVQNWAKEKFGTVTDRQTKIRKKLFELCDKNGIKYDANFPWNSKQEFAHINVFNNISQYPENKAKLNVELIDGSDFYRNSTTNKGFNLYMDMSFLWDSIEEVQVVIKSNGGTTILAHPFGYKANVNVEQLLNWAVEFKLDGIEVYHPKHTPEQIEFLLDFCNKHNLLVSGGSDFHGKPNEHLATNLSGKLWADKLLKMS